MNKLINNLKNLDIVILKNIESAVVSIYKINKEHRLFQPILKEYPQLSNAEYIIYPNINNNQNKIFLDENGYEILSYDGGISEFILIASNLYSNKQPIVGNETPYNTNSLSNYSW